MKLRLRHTKLKNTLKPTRKSLKTPKKSFQKKKFHKKINFSQGNARIIKKRNVKQLNFTTQQHDISEEDWQKRNLDPNWQRDNPMENNDQYLKNDDEVGKYADEKTYALQKVNTRQSLQHVVINSREVLLEMTNSYINELLKFPDISPTFDILLREAIYQRDVVLRYENIVDIEYTMKKEMEEMIQHTESSLTKLPILRRYEGWNPSLRNLEVVIGEAPTIETYNREVRAHDTLAEFKPFDYEGLLKRREQIFRGIPIVDMVIQYQKDVDKRKKLVQDMTNLVDQNITDENKKRSEFKFIKKHAASEKKDLKLEKERVIKVSNDNSDKELQQEAKRLLDEWPEDASFTTPKFVNNFRIQGGALKEYFDVFSEKFGEPRGIDLQTSAIYDQMIQDGGLKV